MLKPARGTALRTIRPKFAFAPSAFGGPAGEIHGNSKLGQSHIPLIRKLLRTDMSLAQIAAELKTSDTTLRHFIRRRNICDLEERRKFNQLKHSTGDEAIE